MSKTKAESIFWVLLGVACLLMGAGIAASWVITAIAPGGFY